MKILDNTIYTLLGEAGLSESERIVYLTGDSVARTSRELIKRTELPRPTVMAALHELRSLGLCDTSRKDGRSLLYVMQPARNLKQHLGKRVRELDTLMERLEHAQRLSEASLEVTDSEGQAGLQDLLERALRCESRKWQIIAPHGNALRYMPKSYTEYFKRVRRERQIESQTLWEDSAKTKNVSLQDVLMRKPRYIPREVAKEIPSLMLAFDDALLVVDGTENPRAVLIQNQATVKTFQIVFELAWRSLRE